jgi:organic radical activating enzyme
MHKIEIKKELKFGQKFCVYPFVHYHVNTNKQRYICCKSQIPVTEDRLKDIRSLMLNNDSVTECDPCYKLEEQKLISYRQQAIKDYIPITHKVTDAIDDHINGKIPTPVDYDFRYSNLCNLECQMCGPDYSSAIAIKKNLDIKFLKSEPQIDINSEAVRIYLAGGEPFLIKSFSSLLHRVTNKNCEIVINTNATILTEHLMSELDQFSNVSFIVSIDGYGKLNEYIRKNSIWESIENNIQILASRYGGYKQINVNTVVQKENINHLLELGTWLEEKQINTWRLTLLTHPEEYQYFNNKSINVPNDLFKLSLINQNIANVLILNKLKQHA